MDCTFCLLAAEDRQAVIDIFNHYIQHSPAAYPEAPVPYEFYDSLLRLTTGYPALAVKDGAGRTVGFGMLRAHHPASSFSTTAEIGYFLLPEFTRQGIGTALLKTLLAAGKARGIHNVLASISSLNEASICFHLRHGFTEVGCFRGIGTKHGQVFDVVWMQKTL